MKGERGATVYKRQVDALVFHLDPSQPLYVQILEQIRNSVVKRGIKLGEKIPFVWEMAHELKINPITAMSTYREKRGRPFESDWSS